MYICMSVSVSVYLCLCVCVYLTIQGSRHLINRLQDCIVYPDQGSRYAALSILS